MSKTDDYIQNISKPDQDLLPWLHWYTHHDSGATGCKPCPTATSTHGLGSLFLGDCGCKQGQNGGETCVIKFSYGSRPKTHARLLVSEWHLQIWMCMFCCSGERPRKGGVRFAKGLNTIIYKPISKRKPDHNLMSRFCWGAKGRERFAKARRKGVFGYHNFGQPPCVFAGFWKLPPHHI